MRRNPDSGGEGLLESQQRSECGDSQHRRTWWAPKGCSVKSCSLEERKGGKGGWREEGEEEKRERGAKTASLHLCFHTRVRVDLFRDMKLIVYYTSGFPEKLYDNFGVFETSDTESRHRKGSMC